MNEEKELTKYFTQFSRIILMINQDSSNQPQNTPGEGGDRSGNYSSSRIGGELKDFYAITQIGTPSPCVQ